MSEKVKKELSRKQAAYRLGCSEMQLIRFEKEGKLHPRRDPGGHHRVWFKTDEVVRLSQEWKSSRGAERIDSKIVERNVRGRIAARVFPLFDEGLSLREIVIRTETDPILVRQLWEEWRLTFDEGKRVAEFKRQRDLDREEQKRHERREDMAEWRKVKLAEIALVKAREDQARADKAREEREKKVGES